MMSTVVPGLVKIGKTATNRFADRMYVLERNGYNNVAGLHRRFAIEVEDYDEKEQMLDEIFSKARVPGSELFALDIDLAVKLLSSFEGRQIYPPVSHETKEQVFATATKQHREHTDVLRIPDGTYHLDYNPRGQHGDENNQNIHVEMIVNSGELTIAAGQHVSTHEGTGLPVNVRELRRAYVSDDGTVTEDVQFDSPSSAGSFVTGRSCNGWTAWRTKNSKQISEFRL